LDGTRARKGEVIEEAIRRFNKLEGNPIERRQVLMIGDRSFDVLGAKEAVITSLGVSYGFARPGELKEAGADFVIQTVAELYALFCGCLSILFAILSRGSGFRMPDKAIAGFIASSFAIVIAVLLSIAVLYVEQFLKQRFGADVLNDPVKVQQLLNELADSYMNSLRTGGNGL